MPTTNFTLDNIRQGFTGVLEPTSWAPAVGFAPAGDTHFAAIMHGTSATLDLFDPYGGGLKVGIDGAAVTNAAVTDLGSNIKRYTLFTGLADVGHVVTLIFNPSGGSGTQRVQSPGDVLAITGAAPSVQVPKWTQLGDPTNLALCVKLASNPLGPTWTGPTHVDSYTLGSGNCPALRTRADFTDLFVFVGNDATTVFVAVDDGPATAYPIVGHMLHLAGLSGLHDYQVWGNNPGGSDIFSVGGFCTVLERPATVGGLLVQGDSKSNAAGTMPQHSVGYIDGYHAANRLGRVGFVTGHDGGRVYPTNGEPDLVAIADGIIAGIDWSSGKIGVVLNGGYNDGNVWDANHQTAYKSWIDKYLAAGAEFVLCRAQFQPIQATLPVGTAAFATLNAGIQALVATYTNGKVRYVSTDGWATLSNPIDTIDNVHETIAGYAQEIPKAVAAYRPFAALNEPSALFVTLSESETTLHDEPVTVTFALDHIPYDDEVITPVLAGLTGAFSGTPLSVTANGPRSITSLFTATALGSGTIGASTSVTGLTAAPAALDVLRQVITYTTLPNGLLANEPATFAVEVNAPLNGPTLLTPACSLAGVFSPAHPEVDEDTLTASWTFTPVETGSGVFTLANDGDLANPASETIEVATQPPDEGSLDVPDEFMAIIPAGATGPTAITRMRDAGDRRPIGWDLSAELGDGKIDTIERIGPDAATAALGIYLEVGDRRPKIEPPGRQRIEAHPIVDPTMQRDPRFSIPAGFKAKFTARVKFVSSNDAVERSVTVPYGDL